MNHKLNLSIKLISVYFLFFFLSSCNKDNYYDTPSWLKGSIYQVLEQRGNYTIFLKGVDLANMKPIVDGKGILTVMAPNDSAFTAYLNENYAGKKIDELPKEEISKLIGFHVLYYAFGKDKLLNFRPLEGDGVSLADQNINAGLYYKFRTKSMDGITIEKDTAGKDVSVYHLERFLPVFSYRMFHTKQIDAKSNYEYFYPNTSWKDNSGFNIANAAVKDYAIVANNGYVYTVDRVLRPLETIYKELASNPDYSDYLKLYNAYQFYISDPNLTLQYGNGVALYQHFYLPPLANIASEWPAKNNLVVDYKAIDQLSSISYSVFAPNNTALNSFFNDYWKVGGYNSLSEVSKTSMNYLLFNSVYTSSIAFPEEIKKGLIKNSYGTVIKFDPDAVPAAGRKMCVNGVLYSLNELTPPAMFGSVTGPAFQYKNYSYFLDWLNASDLVLTLASDQTRFIVLYPSNALINKTGITKDANTGIFKKGTQTFSATTQQTYIYAHTVSIDATPGAPSSLPTSGNHVLRTLSPTTMLYWYLKDGRITNSVKFNELLYIPDATEDKVFSDINELTFRNGWSNGKCYSYENTAYPTVFEGSNANALYNSFIPMIINNRNSSTTKYYGFIQLLDKANLINGQVLSAVVESCLMFIPTTAAVENAVLAGKIPGISTTSTSIDDPNFFINCTVTDATELTSYLLQYFIPLSTAVISNYPFIGWNENITSGLPTLQTYISGGKVMSKSKMLVTDANSKISIRVVDNTGTPTSAWVDVIPDYNYFPFVFDDGCVHFIKDVF